MSRAVIEVGGEGVAEKYFGFFGIGFNEGSGFLRQTLGGEGAASFGRTGAVGTTGTGGGAAGDEEGEDDEEWYMLVLHGEW